MAEITTSHHMVKVDIHDVSVKVTDHALVVDMLGINTKT